MAPRSTRVVPDTQVRSPTRSFAQSLDNFYAPSRDRRGEQSIQQGAAAFSGILGEKAAEMKNEQRKGELQQGVQDAMREEAGQELKGVKTGSLFRQHSKYYMMGLNETRGKAAASKFKSDLTLRYQEWDGRHIDDDGTAFREWMNGQVSEFMGGLGDNQYKIAGAMATVNEVANNFAVQHTAFTAQRLEQESFEAYDEIVAGVFTSLANGEIDMEGAVDRLATEANDMYTTDGAAANDRVVQAAIQYANIHNDPDALLALAKAHDSGKIKLSVANREKLANGMDAVESDIARNTTRDSAKQTAEEKAREKAVIDEWATKLEEDPYAALPSSSEVGGGETKQKLIRMQDALISAGKVENPAITSQRLITLEARLYDAANTAERLQIIQDHVAKHPSDLSGENVKAYTREALDMADSKNLVNDPTVSKYRTGFSDLLGAMETDAYSTDQVLLISTLGKRYFDEYMRKVSGNIDMSDPDAMDEVLQKAEAYAVKRLVRGFGPKVAEAMGGSEGQAAAGEVLGVPGAMEEAQAEAAAAAEALYKELAGVEGKANPEVAQGGIPTEAIEAGLAIAEESGVAPDSDALVERPVGAEATIVDGDEEIIETAIERHQRQVEERRQASLGGTPAAEDNAPVDETVEQREQRLEDVRVKAEPVEPIYEEKELTEDFRPVREGFYGELLQRFTDGKDDRTHNMQSATEVMKNDPEFTAEVDSLAAELGVPAMALMAVMDFESGFSTSIRNAAGSGATGLIQFMPSTARGLGTTTQALAGMNRKQQMVYVRKYFKQYGRRLAGGNVEDIYMAVLWPAAIGKPPGYPIFRSGTIAYRQNKGLDTNGDGVVTKYEAASKVSKKFYGY